MLDTLRQGANSWLAKLLMGLLVLSFGVWGVRYSNNSVGGGTIAQVGGENITAQQYMQLFRDEVRKLERQYGQNLEPNVARQLGADQRVMSGLLVDAQARALNLGIGETALIEMLGKQKSLQGADGKFDPGLLRYALQNQRITEGEFFESMRRDSVREQLLGAVASVPPAPAALVEAVNQFQGEGRTLDYFLVAPGKAPAPPKPDDGKLKAFYEARLESYKAPEYRKLGVLFASPDDIKDKFPVSDDEARGIYENTKATYVTPERRHVFLMSFQDKAKAEKALASIKGGKNFMAVATEMGLAEKDVDRGLVAKTGLIDPVVAESAFKAEKDKSSSLIEGALTTSILRVTDIQPGATRTYESVAADIKAARAREMAIRGLVDYRAKVEDARAAGNALADMPKTLPFKYLDIPAATAEGVGIDGKAIAVALPNLPAVLKNGYAGDVGLESDPVDFGKDGWAWVEVKEVIAARQKSFDEVKGEVEKAAMAADAANALAKLANDLAERANKSEDFAALAKTVGAEVKQAAGLTRTSTNPDVSPAAIQMSFALAKGSTASLAAPEGKGRIVFKLKDVTPAKPLDPAKAESAAKLVAAQLAGAYQGQYVGALRNTLGLRVDEAVFKQVAGAADSGEEP